MIVKLCGIKSQDNYLQLSMSGIDWLGFNFYPESTRYIDPDTMVIKTTADHKRVGVFVNEQKDDIERIAKKQELDIIQLHGNEDAGLCASIQKIKPIIKVFQLDSHFDFSHCKDYAFCNYFLFDTKSKRWGGSGNKFDWTILSRYTGEVPFILAGGIGPDDVDSVKSIKHPSFFGIDINSGFETQAGIKNPALVQTFVKKIKL